MNWSKGYSSEYYMTVIDPVTWLDVDRIEITGGSIQREKDGLMQSASVNCVNYPKAVEKWIRIYLDTDQNGDNGHEALFTGLATSPTQGWNGSIHNDTLECYSVLKPVSDIDLTLGWYAPAGMSGGEVIRELLSVTPAPVIIESNSPTLNNHIIAENGETRLTMIEKVLTAIGWRLRITGSGLISVEPTATDIVQTFGVNENDMIETQINVSQDWFSCPNVFMAIQDEMTAIAKDETSNSPISIENRGREVWSQESGCVLSDNETIMQYAQRRLKEEQQIKLTAQYARRYIPDVYPSDKIRMQYPEQGLDSVFEVRSQNIDLNYEARTNEEIMA